MTALQSADFEVEGQGDGNRVLDEVARWNPDVLVLDLNLPGTDGLTLCRELRKVRQLPILMVSARNEDIDRILGLELGADDYLGKPFHPKELVARVRAMFRRLRLPPADEHDVLQRGDLTILLKTHQVRVGGQPVELTPIEFGLLTCLARRPGATLTRQELLDRVWGPEFVGEERTTDSHIRNLRAKLRRANPNAHYVHSVWGVGYKFSEI